MSNDASRRIDKALFEAAIAIDDPELRQEFLDLACGIRADPRRRDRVAKWLEAHAVAGVFFRHAAFDRAAISMEVAEEMRAGPLAGRLAETPDHPGSRIGRYRLLERLGVGGCGIVFLAEQTEPVRRHVALKLIRSELDSAEIIRRFESDRQTLALMDHPGIARVLDAGATDGGRPFVAMEWVSGESITTHCNARRLNLRERLELFVQVCQAIQHAHQKGVIHRDIKPSNVLVTDRDGTAAPKVIDFGIARVTECRRIDDTCTTADGRFLGTPAYMSPEQAEGSHDVDTRGDIYSLGVLLYELLTGRTPFDSKRLQQAGLLEMLRILREEEPPAASAALSGLPVDELAAAATDRNCTPAALIAALRGDLDDIVAKAMAKERDDRYHTVNSLVSDLRRHLNDEPVLARPPGTLYLLRKLFRRHRLAFGAAAAVAVALIAGFVVSSWFYLQEREARQVQIHLREAADAARANEARLLQQSKARESVSLAAIRLAEGKVAEADALLALTPPSSIEPSREAANLFHTLGHWNAIRLRTRMAADCYALFLQANRFDQTPASRDSMMTLIAIGPTLVEGGRLDDYERFRDESVGRNQEITDPVTTSSLLKATLLAPAKEPLLARLRPHAERLATVLTTPGHPQTQGPYQSAFAALSLAMMAYRGGDFQATLEWRDKCLAYPDANLARAAALHAVSAAAACHLGQTKLARDELANARGILAGPFTRDAEFPRGRDNGVWLDWSIARVLEHEAAGLIDGDGTNAQ